MKRILALVLSMMLMAAMAVTPAAAEEEKVLNIFTWATYVDDETLANFEAETGIKVNYSYFSSNEEMMAKLQANGGSEYDIILASDYALATMREQNLLLPLNKDVLPNYANLNTNYLGQYFDPNSEYVVPYVVGTPLIIYDPALVDIEIKGYADLWDPSLADSIVVVDDARNIIGITLKTMGKSLNETDPAVLAAAKTRLMPLYGNIRIFDYDTPYSAIISGEASVGYMFTTQVFVSILERPDLQIVVPEEGVGIGIDGFAIPVNAPNAANAHALLDYLMDAEVAAFCAEMQYTPTPNKAAEPLLPDWLKNSPALLTAEQAATAEFMVNLGETEAVYQEIWVEFKQQ